MARRLQWRRAVRSETLDRFAEAFAPSGFRREAFLPCYGMSETTLLVSGGPWQSPPVVVSVRAEGLERGRLEPAGGDEAGRSLVGCGRVAEGIEVVIVDPESGANLPDGHVGEILVAGPSVAHGYWGRAEETEHSFGARSSDAGARPFLRTGDLGVLRDGELFVTGRVKDLIIIRGRNVHPQDIEWTVGQSHPALRPDAGAAFSVEAGGHERLVIVQESVGLAAGRPTRPSRPSGGPWPKRMSWMSTPFACSGR
jgi:acyl-CoA synthetase (AMP-forming)/AMP-acid ligase II